MTIFSHSYLQVISPAGLINVITFQNCVLGDHKMILALFVSAFFFGNCNHQKTKTLLNARILNLIFP